MREKGRNEWKRENRIRTNGKLYEWKGKIVQEEKKISKETQNKSMRRKKKIVRVKRENSMNEWKRKIV